jgi:hypothetical protein
MPDLECEATGYRGAIISTAKVVLRSILNCTSQSLIVTIVTASSLSLGATQYHTSHSSA